MTIPENLLYTDEHEWIRVEDNIAYIGITDFAQSELGEIVYVEVETVGEKLEKGVEFGVVEAVKTTSDLFMPIGGTILEFNSELDQNEGDQPALVNEEPYGTGWIVKVEISDASEISDLLDSKAYTDLIS